MILHVDDCLTWLKEQPDDSVDLVMTSPPYEDSRSYNIGFSLKGQDWVDWAVERYIECVRVCKGLVCWVVEGRTKQFRWSATPALLMADLHRAGIKLRKPPIYHRVGIPGSGGPDYWRGDTEWVICASKGKLPWSDNVAVGRPCGFAPGGAVSHRTLDGKRRNQKTGSRLATGRPKTNIANPGNVVSLSVIPAMLERYYEITNHEPVEIVRQLQAALDTQKAYEWGMGVSLAIQSSAVLQPCLYGRTQSETPGRSSRKSKRAVLRPADDSGFPMRIVRDDGEPDTASSGREPDEQRPVEPSGTVQAVPQLASQRVTWTRVPGLRWEKLREGILPYALQPLEKAWQSVSQMCEHAAGDSGECSDIIHCSVGGGRMGSQCAHENEAPFPESLVEPFVRCFCPPGGVTLDPFSGSGTTVAVATKWGRRGIGLDVRQCQVELGRKRLAEVA